MDSTKCASLPRNTVRHLPLPDKGIKAIPMKYSPTEHKKQEETETVTYIRYNTESFMVDSKRYLYQTRLDD